MHRNFNVKMFGIIDPNTEQDNKVNSYAFYVLLAVPSRIIVLEIIGVFTSDEMKKYVMYE